MRLLAGSYDNHHSDVAPEVKEMCRRSHPQKGYFCRHRELAYPRYDLNQQHPVELLRTLDSHFL